MAILAAAEHVRTVQSQAIRAGERMARSEDFVRTSSDPVIHAWDAEAGTSMCGLAVSPLDHTWPVPRGCEACAAEVEARGL